MIQVRFETNEWVKRLAKAVTFTRYVLLRPVVAWFSYHLYYQFRIREKRHSKAGLPLKDGIAFCLVARDEAYTIDACLLSIVGFADQLIAVDNGSTDDTYERMLRFREQYSGVMDITVLHRPDLNLRDCRQLCVDHVQRTWFFRGDGDFLLLPEYKRLKKNILKSRMPGAISLKLIELFGDEHHGNRYVRFIRPGEYYLRSFESDVRYEEFYGRIEHARIPIYYRLSRNKTVGLIHANFCKSNRRIFYRTCYLDYREYVNKHKQGVEFSYYESRWLQHVFQSADHNVTEYRMARLIAVMCERINTAYEDEIARTGIEIFQSPYVVLYRDDKPFLRVLKSEAHQYTSTYISKMEDPAWLPDADEFYADSLRTAFDVNEVS
ncbi:MAG: hypothetical protein K1X61_09385 [Chitinophagales bacterium]|nr:hypothetical protein [Chitinophagales bacterium]